MDEVDGREGRAADHERRYFHILEIALNLIAFARAHSHAPDHLLVAHFMHTLLTALPGEEYLDVDRSSSNVCAGCSDIMRSLP